MSTKGRSEKLAAARKELKKYQSRSAHNTSASKPLFPSDMTEHPLLAAPALESNLLLQPMTAAPELTSPLMITPLTLTTPTDAPVTNGYTPSGGSSLQLSRPLTPTSFTSEHLSEFDHTHQAAGHALSHHLLDSHIHMHSVENYTHSLDHEPNTQVNRDAVPDEAQDRQVQAQTIDILVSEKSYLQSEINILYTDLRNKTREVDDLTSHLNSTREQLEQNEREKLNLAEEKSYLQRMLVQVGGQREESEAALQKMKMALDDMRQENTELISKVTSQASEIHSLQVSTTELKSKLNMAELLTQQLSAETPSTDDSSNRLDELCGEVVRLEGVVRSVSRERDQAVSDLDALRDVMIQQRQETAEKLSELHSRLAESEAEKLSLSEQLQHLHQAQDQLAQDSSTEHAQLQQSAQVAMETLHREKDEIQTQLRSQVEEGGRLSVMVEGLEGKCRESEREAERLREAAVDTRGLLETISSDKEALSRAVSQNRELKTQLEELQEAFVRMSQGSMELASELESERYQLTRLRAQLQETGEEKARGGRGEEEEEDGLAAEVGTQTVWEGEDEEEVDNGIVMAPPNTDMLQAVEEERDALHTQLQEVLGERDALRDEIVQLRSQVAESAANLNTNRDSPTSEDTLPPEPANQTLNLLSSLQTNFNALQERYVAVMTEKAELLEQVEERELTIGRLSGETETIGEYIMLYQTQREALKAKFREKDNFIQQLISEKETLQSQLAEVHRLMRQLTTDTPAIHQSTTHTPPVPSSPSHRPSSPSSSSSSLPLHLRPLVHHRSPSPPPPPPSLPSPPPTAPHSETVDQILQLLSVMGDGGGGEGVKGVVVPCACCTGDIITL